MRRGEIWWADLDAVGRHPVLMLSRDASYRIRAQATAALITPRIRGIPVEVSVGSDEGLPVESVVNLDNLLIVEIAGLHRQVGKLSAEKLLEVERALHFALALSY